MVKRGVYFSLGARAPELLLTALVCAVLSSLTPVSPAPRPAESPEKTQPSSDSSGRTTETGRSRQKVGDKRSLKEINRAWMQELRRNGAAAPKEDSGTRKEQGNGEPGAEKPETAKAGTAPGTLPDPGLAPEQVRLPNPSAHDARAAARPRLFEQGSEDTSFLSVVFRFVAILVVMLGAFYMFARYTRGRRGIAGTGGDLVHVVASVPLIQGKFLQVVDMAGRLLVLGVSDQSVTLLSEVSDARTADRIRLWQSQNRSVPEAARGALSRLTGLIRGTDYRFWNAAAEGKGASPERDSFRKVLRNEGGSAISPVGEDRAVGAERGPFTQAAGVESSTHEYQAGSSRAAASAAELPSRDSVSESSDLFNFSIPAEPGAVPDVDESELRELLRAQRKRLQTLKGSQR